MSTDTTAQGASLREIFAGRRGRLLAALLFGEFGAAVQSIAYSSVLPLASADLHGSTLYGAVLVAGSFTTILMLATGPGPFGRLGPVRLLMLGTGLYVGGVLITVLAVSMAWILVGTLVRGVAAGLLAAFGLTAIGALYEDRVRPRVMGLFAVVWLLPSLAGPALNAAIAVAIGWRGAMAWPALVVLVARLLIGRDAGMIPWKASTGQSLDLRNAAVLLLGLALAAAAPAADGGWGIAMLVAGLIVAVLVSLWILRAHMGKQVVRFATTASFFSLCLAFFGGSAVISLAVVEALGRGAVASNIAVGAGLVAWSATGLRSPRFDARVGDTTVVGPVLLTGALVVAFGALTPLPNPTLALVVLVAAWFVAGLGMGLAYPRISSEAMDNLAPERVVGAATAVAFAETAGTAVGSLLSGGTYSLASAHHVASNTSIGLAFLMLAAIALVAAAIRVVRRHAKSRLARGTPDAAGAEPDAVVADHGTGG